MDIACLLFDGITALDVVGPYEVLQRLPGARREVRRQASAGAVRTDNGFLGARRRLLASTRSRAPTCSSCPAASGRARSSTTSRRSSGSARSTPTTHVDHVGVHRLAAARGGRAARGQGGDDALGVARPARASTARSRPARRVVEQGKIITAAGVSSGIDMALHARGAHRRRRGRAGRSSSASSTTRSRRSTRGSVDKAPDRTSLELPRRRCTPAALTHRRTGVSCGTDIAAALTPVRRYLVTMTAEPWPKRPWLIDRPTRAPSTWRPSARPCTCQVSSHTCAIACAGTASPKHARPPLGFTGMRPPIVVAPSRTQLLGLARRAQADLLVPVELHRGREVVDLGAVEVVGAEPGFVVRARRDRLLEPVRGQRAGAGRAVGREVRAARSSSAGSSA